jgi:hypothetical protein
VATAAPCLSVRISARKRDNDDNNYEKTLVSARVHGSFKRKRERKREREVKTNRRAGKRKKKPKEGICFD